jgi:ATP-dependent DNA helicase DinG
MIGVERFTVPMGLIARWAMATSDGDLFGGDLPGWFAELFGHSLLTSIADRRGECIHAGCPHFSTCLIEHVIRNARQADLVIANHALVMAQAVWGGLDDDFVPTRYVFDEGHHIFDAGGIIGLGHGRLTPLAAGGGRGALAGQGPRQTAGRDSGR